MSVSFKDRLLKTIKDQFQEEEELMKSPLKETAIRYDHDLNEYQFNFDSACKLLKEGGAIFKTQIEV